MEECPFCLISVGKIPVKKIYEDNKVIAILDINPANKGHTLVIPRKHYPSLSLVPPEEIEHIFKVANNISTALLEISEGTNLLVSNGVSAGQKVEHILIHVIPRFENDGINFGWNPRKQTEEELSKLQEEIKKRIPPLEETKPKKGPVDGKPYERYLIKPENRRA